MPDGFELFFVFAGATRSLNGWGRIQVQSLIRYWLMAR